MIPGGLKQRLRHALPAPAYSFAESVSHLRPAHRRFLEAHEALRIHRERLDDRVEALIGSTEVQTGPWQGLILSREATWGMDYSARLLGTYEKELHETFETILASAVPHIVDVGCADGYYVAGLALRAPGAEVIAYDSDPAAAHVTARLAALNSVDNRVTTKGLCKPADLTHLPSGSLVLMDCEGAEAELVSEAVVATNPRARFVIECHDSIVPGISAQLRGLFEQLGRHVQLVHPTRRVATDAPTIEPELAVEVLDELRQDTDPWLVAL